MTDDDICPVCGTPAIQVDVGVIGLISGWQHGIPEDAVDVCVGAHGFNSLSPIGGITLGWHDEMIEPEDVTEDGAAYRDIHGGMIR